MPSPYSLSHQFKIAQDALGEARNLLKAKYYTSSVSNSFQVALRGAAGLLYGLNLDPKTEQEVRVAFASRFIPEHAPDRCHQIYRELERMRHQSDFEYEYTATREDAEHALALAEEFHAEALRLQKEVLK